MMSNLFRFSMTHQVDNLVSKLIEEERHTVENVPNPHGSVRTMTQTQSIPVTPESSLGSSVVTPAAQLHPTTPGSQDIWFYRDPQGNVQGPFATTEMQLWLTQGYFSGGLLLRRECDRLFITLSEMGKLYGRNPFAVMHESPAPPPLQVSRESRYWT
jgi:hypothetical protein